MLTLCRSQDLPNALSFIHYFGYLMMLTNQLPNTNPFDERFNRCSLLAVRFRHLSICRFLIRQGPLNPFKTEQQLAAKNTLTGYVEDAHFNAFHFENQRRTFHSYGTYSKRRLRLSNAYCNSPLSSGYAVDPSIDDSGTPGTKMVSGDIAEELISKNNDEREKTVAEKVKKREGDKRKRVRCNDPEDLDGFLGPWGGFVDDNKIAKPTEVCRVLLIVFYEKGLSTESLEVMLLMSCPFQVDLDNWIRIIQVVQFD